jgi:hypothetical protein
MVSGNRHERSEIRALKMLDAVRQTPTLCITLHDTINVPRTTYFLKRHLPDFPELRLSSEMLCRQHIDLLRVTLLALHQPLHGR